VAKWILKTGSGSLPVLETRKVAPCRNSRFRAALPQAQGHCQASDVWDDTIAERQDILGLLSTLRNSLFPFTTHSEIFLDGVKVETLQDGTVNIRPGDMGFDGASHRAPSQVVWHPWAGQQLR
jgi:hypothetical protein